MALVALLLFLGIVAEAVMHARDASRPLAVGLDVVIVQAVALYWRRSHSVAVFAVVICAMLAGQLFGLRDTPGLALPAAVYSVSVYAQPMPRLAVAGLGVLAVLVGIGGSLILRSDAWAATLGDGAISLVAWVIGDYTRNRRRYLVELQARPPARAAERGESPPGDRGGTAAYRPRAP